MSEDPEEILYYRAVEDHFAAARGLPHTLSPKDVQLLRTWWREEVPMEAIVAGITEVFAHRQQRGDKDGPVSLTYCRHAVRRQARLLAEMRVGREQTVAAADPETTRYAVAQLSRRLEEAAAALPPRLHAANELIRTAAAGLAEVEVMDAQAVETHLYNLETTLMQGCLNALPVADRARMEKSARAEAEATGAGGKALDRTTRAMLDRELRTMLRLPRLELV